VSPSLSSLPPLPRQSDLSMGGETSSNAPSTSLSADAPSGWCCCPAKSLAPTAGLPRLSLYQATTGTSSSTSPDVGGESRRGQTQQRRFSARNAERLARPLTTRSLALPFRSGFCFGHTKPPRLPLFLPRIPCIMTAAPLFSAPALQLNVRRATSYGALAAAALNAFRYPLAGLRFGRKEGRQSYFYRI